MLTVRFHSSVIHRVAPRRGATALAPGARSVAPRGPPSQTNSEGEKCPFERSQNLLFLRTSETPKTDPSGGSIKAIIPGSIRVIINSFSCRFWVKAIFGKENDRKHDLYHITTL
jgi:hypothetical protein